jgi:hypothetical protein
MDLPDTLKKERSYWKEGRKEGLPLEKPSMSFKNEVITQKSEFISPSSPRLSFYLYQPYTIIAKENQHPGIHPPSKRIITTTHINLQMFNVPTRICLYQRYMYVYDIGGPPHYHQNNI